MKNKNFSKNFDDVFDEEQLVYNEFNYYGYSSSKIGIAQSIPFRMQIKSFSEENELMSYLNIITERQNVVFGGVEKKEVYDQILQEEVEKYFLRFALLVDGD